MSQEMSPCFGIGPLRGEELFQPHPLNRVFVPLMGSCKAPYMGVPHGLYH